MLSLFEFKCRQRYLISWRPAMTNSIRIYSYFNEKNFYTLQSIAWKTYRMWEKLSNNFDLVEGMMIREFVGKLFRVTPWFLRGEWSNSKKRRKRKRRRRNFVRVGWRLEGGMEEDGEKRKWWGMAEGNYEGVRTKWKKRSRSNKGREKKIKESGSEGEHDNKKRKSKCKSENKTRRR